MARSQSCYSRAFGLQKLTFCIAMLTTLPVLAQPAGPDTGIEPEKVLASEPDTANGRFEAALLMVKLARPELNQVDNGHGARRFGLMCGACQL